MILILHMHMYAPVVCRGDCAGVRAVVPELSKEYSLANREIQGAGDWVLPVLTVVAAVALVALTDTHVTYASGMM